MSAARLTLQLLFGVIFIAFINSAMATRSRTSELKSVTDLSFKLTGRCPCFPCDSTREIYRETGKYIPKNIISTRMQIYRYDVVLTLPRLRPGTPLTLGITTLRGNGFHANVTAFPDWSMQKEGNCDAIQSAVDIFLDRRNVLWVLDAGTVNSLEHPSTKCSPKVLAICMTSRKIIHTIDLSEYITEKSDLQYITAENAENFNDYVYISDAGSNAIIVLDASMGFGKRLILPKTVAEDTPASKALYMVLLMKGDSKKYLYFTYLESQKVYYVDTVNLHTSDNQSEGCIHVAGKKPHGDKIVFCGTDGISNLYFRKKGGSDIYAWDSNTPLKSENIELVQHSPKDRQATHVTIGPWKLLWVIETNIGDYIKNTAGSIGPSSIIHPLRQDWNAHDTSNIRH